MLQRIVVVVATTAAVAVVVEGVVVLVVPLVVAFVVVVGKVCVQLGVRFEARNARESLVAQEARVRAIIGVKTHVHLQAVHLREAAHAHPASVVWVVVNGVWVVVVVVCGWCRMVLIEVSIQQQKQYTSSTLLQNTPTPTNIHL